MGRRWGVIDLLDVLKNADFLTGFTEELSSVMSRGNWSGPWRRGCLIFASWC